MDRALASAGLDYNNIDYCCSTGYGREMIPFAQDNISEISCHGKGTQWLVHSVRTVIDVGGQDWKVIRVDKSGKLDNFVMNDKCAAGTGRFLELVAEALELSLDELASLAFQSTNPAKVSSQCCVFAESEVITLVNEGHNLIDIVAGVHDSITRRLAAIVGTVSIMEDVVMTGGCAKNSKLVEGLGKQLKVQIKIPAIDLQVIGALGTALLAQDKLSKV